MLNVSHVTQTTDVSLLIVISIFFFCSTTLFWVAWHIIPHRIIFQLHFRIKHVLCNVFSMNVCIFESCDKIHIKLQRSSDDRCACVWVSSLTFHLKCIRLVLTEDKWYVHYRFRWPVYVDKCRYCLVRSKMRTPLLLESRWHLDEMHLTEWLTWWKGSDISNLLLTLPSSHPFHFFLLLI